jgi:hypothetical protein
VTRTDRAAVTLREELAIVHADEMADLIDWDVDIDYELGYDYDYDYDPYDSYDERDMESVFSETDLNCDLDYDHDYNYEAGYDDYEY